MKATGIVRRIDELGRIVIPKEIRRTHKIREGTPLEIFSGESGELMLKKYSPIVELEDVASDSVKSVYDVLELDCFVCDKDNIIALEGSINFKKDYLHKNISLDLEKLIENRKAVILNQKDGANLVPITKELEINYNSLIVVPILAEGDTYGAICLVSNNNLTNFEVKILQTFANFISLQIS